MSTFIGSTSPLTASSTFISVSRQTDRADTINGSAFADVAGTLYVEQSGDGVNWDVSQSFAVAANTGVPFKVDVYLPFFRLRYVNGATAQGTFRLFSNLRDAGPDS